MAALDQWKTLEEMLCQAQQIMHQEEQKMKAAMAVLRADLQRVKEGQWELERRLRYALQQEEDDLGATILPNNREAASDSYGDEMRELRRKREGTPVPFCRPVTTEEKKRRRRRRGGKGIGAANIYPLKLLSFSIEKGLRVWDPGSGYLHLPSLSLGKLKNRSKLSGFGMASSFEATGWLRGRVKAVPSGDCLVKLGNSKVQFPLEKNIQVVASKGVELIVDALVQVLSDTPFVLIALPGGMPGNLIALETIGKKHAADGRPYAAICASLAVVLDKWGILNGLKTTCHPSFMDQLSSAVPVDASIQQDGKVVTNRRPGTALEFALVLVEKLFGKGKWDEVVGPLMLYSDVIQTYVFWNVHEPYPENYNFEGRYDLVRFMKTVQQAGLYAHLRIGPYVCAEWNFGGFPVWLKYVPGISFRTDNEPFKNAMQSFTEKIMSLTKSENLYESQGGPIILSQIENEYGPEGKALGSQGYKYMTWAANIAVELGTGVPTMWTEAWSGWFTEFGGTHRERPVEDLAFTVARFIQKGGSFVDYYMYHGGTNFGSTAGGPFITTSYDYDAPIDEYGLIRQPKWGHLNELHKAIKLSEPALVSADPVVTSLGNFHQAYFFSSESGGCAAFLTNADPQNAATVFFNNMHYSLPPWSTSTLPDCKTEKLFFKRVQMPKEKEPPRLSATDRANNILALAPLDSSPEDFNRAGHIFPLKCREGGVLKRAAVLEGFFWSVTSIMGHTCTNECQLKMWDGLLDLIVSYHVIHHLGDFFPLYDRPQVEGSPFPSPILFGLSLMTVLSSRYGIISYIDWVSSSPKAVEKPLDKDKVVETVGPANKVGSSFMNKVIVGVASFPLTNNDLAEVQHSAAFGCLKGQEKSLHGQLAQVNEQDIVPLSELMEKSMLVELSRDVAEVEENVSCSPIKSNHGTSTLWTSTVSSKLQNTSTKQDMKPLLPQENEKLTREDGSFSQQEDTIVEVKNEDAQDTNLREPVSVIAETSLVSLLSLLTAVLLQANKPLSSEQGCYVLSSNFEEVAIGVLKVLNNLAIIDMMVLQTMLARPDLQMEFFHLMSFLLSHCTSTWKCATNQVGLLLLETLILLGYLALFHLGNQAVLRWDTLVVACNGCEQNRGVVHQEISMEMLLSVLKSCRQGSLDSPWYHASLENLSMDSTSKANRPALGSRRLQADIPVKPSLSNQKYFRDVLGKGGFSDSNGLKWEARSNRTDELGHQKEHPARNHVQIISLQGTLAAMSHRTARTTIS